MKPKRPAGHFNPRNVFPPNLWQQWESSLRRLRTGIRCNPFVNSASQRTLAHHPLVTSSKQLQTKQSKFLRGIPARVPIHFMWILWRTEAVQSKRGRWKFEEKKRFSGPNPRLRLSPFTLSIAADSMLRRTHSQHNEFSLNRPHLCFHQVNDAARTSLFWEEPIRGCSAPSAESSTHPGRTWLFTYRSHTPSKSEKSEKSPDIHSSYTL